MGFNLKGLRFQYPAQHALKSNTDSELLWLKKVITFYNPGIVWRYTDLLVNKAHLLERNRVQQHGTKP